MNELDPSKEQRTTGEDLDLLDGEGRSRKRGLWIALIFVAGFFSAWAVMKSQEQEAPIEIDQYLPDPAAPQAETKETLPPTQTEVAPLIPVAPPTEVPPVAPVPDEGAQPSAEEPSAPVIRQEDAPAAYMPPSRPYSDLPDSLRGEISERDWVYLEPAIVNALAAGERNQFIAWNNPEGAAGTAFQSGTGEDESGCRQVRVTIEDRRFYVEKCANGQYK